EPVKAEDLAAVSKREVEEFKELTITVEVTEEQFEAVREKFEAVETIDLSTIENEVLPAQALSGLENLKTVVLPENVTTIGEGAFQGCKNLESVTIPGVSAIGEGAFYGCDNLTSVLLPAAGSGPKTRSGEALGITAESFRGLNPNCLIYLNDVSIPNSDHLNIILNKGTTRVADSDINIDTNYPFNAPASFNLGDYKITFTAHVPGSLNADVDGGWTGLILPFTPTAWEYGVPMPEREGVNAGLVLRTIGEDDSLVEVTPETFQANRPFLAHVVAPYESVPVTFYARTNNDPENYDLPFTPSPETMCTEGKKFVLYGSLDGETVMGTTWDINERGDKFVPTDSEKIVPFEAYMMPVGNPGVAEYVIGNHEFWMANPSGAGVSGTNLYRGDKVELTAGTEGATIYYTLDGSNPKDPNSTRAIYGDPIKMEAGADGIMNVKAVAEYKGNISDVVTLSFQLKRVDLNYDLAQNWNWISHNMESNVDVADFMGNSVSRVLSQTQDKFRDPKFGLIGNLEVLEPAKAYKVCASEATTANIAGIAFNPTATVKINKGWNWIGCPVDDASLKISDLFANFEAEEGDMIIGLDGFTQYDSFGEWVGTVDALVSNAGYLIYSNSEKEFNYNFVHEPGVVAEAPAAVKIASTRTLEDTPWVVDNHRYPSVMPLTASIVDADGFDADPADYKIAAFCGSECRGIGVNVNGVVMINIHGNVGDNIVIRYIDTYNNEYITSTELTFDEMPVGTISNPYTITLDAVASVSSIMVDGYQIITENGSIVVKGELAANASVEVYDLAGNLISASTAVNGAVTLNGLEPGVRLIVIRNGANTIYRKLMVK
ncbi:MAG: leucine-rich repeat protein, partial [Muribaculaceae bacterium]|nr:leucine-rich repeat protein [Muribaculaceae bacterium]